MRGWNDPWYLFLISKKWSGVWRKSNSICETKIKFEKNKRNWNQPVNSHEIILSWNVATSDASIAGTRRIYVCEFIWLIARGNSWVYWWFVMCERVYCARCVCVYTSIVHKGIEYVWDDGTSIYVRKRLPQFSTNATSHFIINYHMILMVTILRPNGWFKWHHTGDGGANGDNGWSERASSKTGKWKQRTDSLVGDCMQAERKTRKQKWGKKCAHNNCAPIAPEPFCRVFR